MLRRSLFLAAALASALSAAEALAADMHGAVPPPVVYAAPTPACAPHWVPAPLDWLSSRSWTRFRGIEPTRLIYVAPYDPRCPPSQPEQIYVPPRTAYLASSPTRFTECVWPCRDQIHQSWYDGKLWYYNAGTPNRPDVFMIIQQDSWVRFR